MGARRSGPGSAAGKPILFWDEKVDGGLGHLRRTA